jgi:hypothetical protein
LAAKKVGGWVASSAAGKSEVMQCRLLIDMEIWHALTVVGFEERGVQWISFLCKFCHEVFIFHFTITTGGARTRQNLL